MENWSESRDILRCNPDFHERERWDCILSEAGGPGGSAQFSQLKALIWCKLLSGRRVDVALVQIFNPHVKWKPNTIWDGCKVVEEGKLTSFLLMDEVIRGALLAPAFGSENKGLYYPIDTIDSDMYLRAAN